MEAGDDVLQTSKVNSKFAHNFEEKKSLKKIYIVKFKKKNNNNWKMCRKQIGQLTNFA